MSHCDACVFNCYGGLLLCLCGTVKDESAVAKWVKPCCRCGKVRGKHYRCLACLSEVVEVYDEGLCGSCFWGCD